MTLAAVSSGAWHVRRVVIRASDMFMLFGAGCHMFMLFGAGCHTRVTFKEKSQKNSSTTSQSRMRDS
eukprot:6483726-Amphidinium_carterae.1